MTKSFVYLSIFIFGTAGSYLPTLFGDNNFFSGWSILGGMFGGILGIWVAVKAYRSF